MRTAYVKLGAAGGIGGLLARSDGYSGGNWTTHNYYHADGGGNVTYMINSAQSMVATYKYDPFGRTLSASGTLAAANLYRFSSKQIHLNSGFYYYGYRFYDPMTQRWMNRDPIGEPGFALLRRGLRSQLAGGPNRYLFVRNNPNGFIDFDGLDVIAIPFPIGGAGAGAGGIAGPIGGAFCAGAAIGAGLCWAFPNTMTLPGKWIGNLMCPSKLPTFDPNNKDHQDALKKCAARLSKYETATEAGNQPPLTPQEIYEFYKACKEAQGIDRPPSVNPPAPKP
ncbi:MAG: hypothetical protein M1608_03095 [Candidatus Omnitrophica bacterium]|nr:hypothetical protein [Candidatus Omnitrophota bacterium]